MKYKRLNLIVNQIKKNERVLDIGTDHGLVPIFLLKKNITNNIMASDLNEEPLNAAKLNLEKEGYLDSVELKLMNGIEHIDPNDFDTIIIAGMGGQTISKIIESKEFKGRYLIHATTNIPQVRNVLQNIDMKITNE